MEALKVLKGTGVSRQSTNFLGPLGELTNLRKLGIHVRDNEIPSASQVKANLGCLSILVWFEEHDKLLDGLSLLVQCTPAVSKYQP